MHSLLATTTEAGWEGILRNVGAGCIVALVSALCGVVIRYGKGIIIGFKNLLKSLENADLQFTAKLEEVHVAAALHNAADEDYQTETTNRLDGIEKSQKEEAFKTGKAIKEAQKAATQATIAATEATAAAKNSTEATARIETKLDTLTRKVDDLPQVARVGA